MITQSHLSDVDRFIPTKNQEVFNSYRNKIIKTTSNNNNNYNYENFLKQNICPETKVLNYHNKQNIESNNNNNKLARCFSVKNNLGLGFHKQFSKQLWSDKKSDERKLLPCLQAQKILDVPGTKDDFYLNSLDWSAMGPLGIALDNEAFLYTPNNIIQLCKILDGTYISCIKFWESTVSLGYSDGKIRVYDIQTNSMIRQIHEHEKRVSALSFSSANIMYSGSKDKNIIVSDIRIKDSSINRLSSHRGEICSLKIQPTIQNYLASGSNDNAVIIWDIRRHQLFRKYTEHKGAVKAISWCPSKSGVISTAGGAGDKAIRIWNINQAEEISVKRTQTQISSLVWHEQTGLIISSHGHPNNQINFWRPQSTNSNALNLQQVKTLKGHGGRILNLAMSPSECMISSLSSDQTLRFWRFLQCDDPWQPKSNCIAKRWSFKLK